MFIVALALFAQVELQPFPAYLLTWPTTDQPLLVDDTGRYTVTLGQGCDGLQPPINVGWLPGSHDVGALRVEGSDTLCRIHIEAQVSDVPCATNDAGACDVAAEEAQP